MVVQPFDERCPLLCFPDEPPVLLVEIHLLRLDPSDVILKLTDLVDFTLATVPGRNLGSQKCMIAFWKQTAIQSKKMFVSYLVFASPPDVSAEGELVLAELVFRQQVVKLVHGQVNDLLDRDG